MTTAVFESCIPGRWPTALMLAGAASLVLAGSFSWELAWGGLLVVSLMIAGFGIGGAFFLSFQTLTGARWSRPLTPAARQLAGTLPAAAASAGLVAIIGLCCYPWAQGEAARGATFWFKNAWLSPGFFVGRSIVYVVTWALVGHWMSRRYAPGKAVGSALAAVLLALTICLAGFDWIMSLEPLWFSTMFGVYQFAGVFLSALGALVLAAGWRRRTGADTDGLDVKTLHDLGKLLFGFCCFWMYIWFSQYMLIWYANIPEESVYFIDRMQGLWWPVSLLSLLLNWGIPFCVLLPRPSKQSWTVMARMALVILLGRWVDLCIAVLPPLEGPAAAYGLSELGSLLLAVGLCGWFLNKPPAAQPARHDRVHAGAAA